MRKYVLFIMFLILMAFSWGCRAKREASVSQSSTVASEIGVELHDLQRLWSSMAERLNLKIEFYPAEGGPEKPTTDNCVPIDPNDSHIGTLPTIGGFGGSGGVGLGSVKSIEISSEKVVSDSSLSHTDSTADSKSATAESLQSDKKIETRQDNGTVAIVAIVFAVAGLIYLVIKSMLKK